MKKIKLSKTFLKVGKILAIVGIAVFAVLLLVFTVVAIIGIVSAASSDGTDEDVALAVAGAVTALVVAIVEFSILIAGSIASLILNIIASKGLERATNKAEAKKPAILAIVSGALIAAFGIPAGILALCTKDEDWQEVNASQQVVNSTDSELLEAEVTETEVK